MAEEIITVTTDEEQVTTFCRFAEKFKTDFQQPPLSGFLEADLEDVFKFLISAYRPERGEIIVRPQIYFDLVRRTGKALDCDDAFIFMTALMRAAGVPADKILVCEVAEEQAPDEYCHIFCAVMQPGEIIWLDNLPGSIFGAVKYPEHLMRVTHFSDYL